MSVMRERLSWRAIARLSLVASLVLSVAANARAEGEAPGAPTTTYLPFVPREEQAPVPSPQPSPTVVPGQPTPTPTSTAAPAPPVGTPSPNLSPSVLGIELYDLVGESTMAAQAGATWVRKNALVWSDVETIEGQRNWAGQAHLEAELIEASRQGLIVILVIRHTPLWARKYANSVCGPIKSDKFDAFARFARDAVLRYSKPPYNVKYWELYNEPDAGVNESNVVYGCWGDYTLPQFGGRYYADMLKRAYPQMKAADAQIRVMIGGLLMPCNPDIPGLEPPHWDCRLTTFFDGILAGGGGPYFDGVSFHTYDSYWGMDPYFGTEPGYYGQQGWESAYNTTGPLVIAKTRYLRDRMNRYGVTGKFLMDTENAVLCWSACAEDDQRYDLTKAYYVVQSTAAAMAEGLSAIIWYSLQGWAGSGMVSANLTPKAAYTAFQVTRQKLSNVTYLAPVSPIDLRGASDIMGYKFRRSDGGQVWVLWSLDGDPHTITLPAVPTAITGPLGEQSPAAQRFTLTIKPVFVEF